MIKTPRKLKIALMMIAGRTFMQRVEMQVAIAFGASVQPLTKMTPRVRRTEIAIIGFVVTWPKNSVSETSKTPNSSVETRADPDPVDCDDSHRGNVAEGATCGGRRAVKQPKQPGFLRVCAV